MTKAVAINVSGIKVLIPPLTLKSLEVPVGHRLAAVFNTFIFIDS